MRTRLRRARVQHGNLGMVRRLAEMAVNTAVRIGRRVVQRRNHVFRYEAGSPKVLGPAKLVIRRYERHDEIPRELISQMQAAMGARSVESDRWEMDHGAVLWIALVGSSFAGMSMSRRAEHYTRWLLPLGSKDMIIFRNATIPGQRGKGICPALMQHIIASELVDGQGQAYVDSRVYNRASIRSIEKSGFRKIATVRPLPVERQYPNKRPLPQ